MPETCSFVSHSSKGFRNCNLEVEVVVLLDVKRKPPLGGEVPSIRRRHDTHILKCDARGSGWLACAGGGSETGGACQGKNNEKCSDCSEAGNKVGLQGWTEAGNNNETCIAGDSND